MLTVQKGRGTQNEENKCKIYKWMPNVLASKLNTGALKCES